MKHIFIKSGVKEQRKKWELKLRLENLTRTDIERCIQGSKLKTDHSESRRLPSCLLWLHTVKEKLQKKKNNGQQN